MEGFSVHFVIIAVPCLLIGLIPVVGPVIGVILFGFLATVLVTLKPYKWHFVFLWFLLGALPPNPWSFSGIGTSGESLKEAVFSRHRPGFRPFVHPAIP